MEATDHRTRFQIACELADFGARMVESRFRREHPEATDDEVSEAVSAWWRHRPGAPNGDAVGPARLLDPP